MSDTKLLLLHIC